DILHVGICIDGQPNEASQSNHLPCFLHVSSCWFVAVTSFWGAHAPQNRSSNRRYNTTTLGYQLTFTTPLAFPTPQRSALYLFGENQVKLPQKKFNPQIS
ncbi:MAG: hypothetical protein NZ483_11690, partial [Verrucomicrobiae bacterium]|nr:hypothetical protein [Verrucomicrobiae bacterium]